MTTNPPNRFRQTVLSSLRESRAALIISALALAGVIATELAAPWPLKLIFDYVLLGKPLPESMAWLSTLLSQGPTVSLVVMAGSIAVLALLGGGLTYLQIYHTSRLGHRLVYRLRQTLFTHLQQLSLSYYSKTRSGELLTKVANDTAVVREVFAEWMLVFAAQSLMLVGSLIIMVMLNWRLSLVVLATLPVLIAVLWILNRKLRNTVRDQRRHESRMASRLNEVLASMPLVQAFGREDYESRRFEAESAQNLEVGVQSARVIATVTRAVSVVVAIGTSATVLFGAWQVLDGVMTPGDLLVFVAYVRGLYKPIRDLGKLSAKISRALVSARRIDEILQVAPTTADAPQAVEPRFFSGDIRFDQVSFSHPDGSPVLRNAHLHIRAGEHVALVGQSGTGKSTVLSLLLRLLEPDEGSIQIDGRPIAQYRRESLRREVGVVLQDTVLFGVSVRENIAYGKLDATQSDIEEAARLAHAHDFIQALPDGYETILSERGGSLSGGQRQRICLARALIKQPSILLLDEPTSAIDPESAALIDRSIAEFMRDKTTIVVAHHFSNLRGFDRVLTLKDGVFRSGTEPTPDSETERLPGAGA